jgi:hypothetical protein
MADFLNIDTKILTNELFKTKLKYLSTMVINQNLIGVEVKGRLYLGGVSCSSAMQKSKINTTAYIRNLTRVHG